MAAIGRQPLPRALYAFLSAVERLNPPPDVQPTLKMLRECTNPYMLDDENKRSAAVKRKPREFLNRRVGQHKRQHPQAFRELWRWARTPPVGQVCSSFGAYWAWKPCRAAFAAIHRGAEAHAAFGMDKSRPDHKSGFTERQDAALIYDHLRRQGMSAKDALQRACQDVGKDFDPSSIRRAVKKYVRGLKPISEDFYDATVEAARQKAKAGGRSLT